jgi:hypothetical protein
MRNPVRLIDAQWRVRICSVLVGAIFVMSQFVTAPPPVSDDVKTARTAASMPVDRSNEIDAD